jgi:Flp pilus assembly protein TadG
MNVHKLRSTGDKPRRGGSTRRGAAAVELALVVIFLMLVVLLMIEMGQAITCYQAVVNSSRVGARFAGGVSQVVQSASGGATVVRAATLGDVVDEIQQYLVGAFPYAAANTVKGAADVTITVTSPDGTTTTFHPTAGSSVAGTGAALTSIQSRSKIEVNINFDFEAVSWLQIVGFRFKPVLNLTTVMQRQ